ncbi:MAG: transposase family protein [Thioploca sp.]|nr:transposase family protein [Thioploca sp.]
MTAADKKYNRQLASLRYPIEQVNRRCKIFRVGMPWWQLF